MKTKLMTTEEMIKRIKTERPETLAAEKWLRICLALCIDRKSDISDNNVSELSCALCKEYYIPSGLLFLTSNRNPCRKCPYAIKFRSCNHNDSNYTKFVCSDNLLDRQQVAIDLYEQLLELL